MHHFSCSVYQDCFLTDLHLVVTALETLQHKKQDTFSPMAIKCLLTNWYILIYKVRHHQKNETILKIQIKWRTG